MNSREAFERVFSNSCVDLSKDETGEYSSQPTRMCYSFFVVGWQEQQKRIDELNQNNEKLRLDHAAYKKGVKNIIQEKLKQIEGRNFTIAAMERSFVLANAKVDELQARVDAALKETQHASRYVEEDMRGNHEFLQMAMIRTFKSLAQALKGGEV
ncbi:hypothetical protein QK338_01165 [Acinetobacter ursingii]|nr:MULTISPECIES: hypothetical protein [Acinetobacter]MDI3236738.1 hypothetical protein [Acinetobacter ursingii]